MTGARAVYALKCVGSLLLYMCLSISLTFYQKSLLTGLRFPLSIVVAHLSVKFLLAAVMRQYLECTYDQQRCTLDWRHFWRRVAAPAVASGLDIGLSQWSLVLVNVSLYTLTKSTSVVFIYLCALLFRLEKLTCSMVAVVVMICCGLVLFTYESASFNLFGFSLALIASVCSGVRWTLSQMLMQKHELGLSSPVDMIYHIQPLMIATLLPMAVMFEGVSVVTSDDLFLSDNSHHSLHVTAAVLVGCLLAFLMDLAEFFALRTTSSVTLCITGVLKEIVTLTLAVTAAGDPLTPPKLAGLMVCVAGIGGHAALKIDRLRHGPAPSTTPARPGAASLPLLAASDSQMALSSLTTDEDEEDDDVLFQSR